MRKFCSIPQRPLPNKKYVTVTARDNGKLFQAAYEAVKKDYLECLTTQYYAAFLIAVHKKFPNWGAKALTELMCDVSDCQVALSNLTDINEIWRYVVEETGVEIRE